MFDRARRMNGESNKSLDRCRSLLVSARQPCGRYRPSNGCVRSKHSRSRNRAGGFTVPELLIAMIVGTILTAIAVPVFNSAMARMRLNSTVSALTGAVSKAHYRSIMNSQVYTLVLTTPGDTYLVTNVTTGTADPVMPLPSQAIAINGGTNATYAFTFCPNGTVYGAGGACPGANAPPALTATYQGRQVNINVSSVGNVTTATIY